MIADFLRKGIAWARGFFWVSDSDTGGTKPREQSSSRPAGAAQRSGAGQRSGKATAKRASAPAAGQPSTAKRRSAEEKTSTGKRGTGAAKRTTAQAAGSKAAGSKDAASKAAGSKSGASKPLTAKSTGPGAPEADPAKPGDLSEIKGIGPAMKTKLAGLGIKTFADLAGADATQVAKSLDQRTITPERVRGWIADAKKRS